MTCQRAVGIIAAMVTLATGPVALGASLLCIEQEVWLRSGNSRALERAIEVFDKRETQLRSQLLDEATLSQIATQLTESNRSTINQLSQMVLERMIQGQRPAIQRRLRQIHSRILSESAGSQFNGVAYRLSTIRLFDLLGSRFTQVYLLLPRSMRGGPIELFVRIHELEHALQYEILSRRQPRIVSKADLRKLKFLFEKGAMLAESHVLRALTDGQREQVRAEVRELPNLPVEIRALVIRSIDNSGLSPRQYVEAEWRAGRYSAEFWRNYDFTVRKYELPPSVQSARDQVIRRQKLVLALLVGVPTSSALLRVAILTACNQVSGEPARSSSVFFSSVCEPLHLGPARLPKDNVAPPTR